MRPPRKPAAKPAAPKGRARSAPKAAAARKAAAPKSPAKTPPAKTPPAKKPPAKKSEKAAAKPALVQDVRQFRVQADDDGIRLDRWFKRHLPDIGFNLVSRWARTGQLRVDGARATPGDRIEEGQVIRVPPAEAKAPPPVKRVRVVDLSADEIAFAQEMVIHRDPQAIVVNKPPGLATQGGTKTSEHLDGLLDALIFEAEGRPKLVHRLDKDTSGALVLARTSRAAAFFAKSFSSRTARKVYWAI
ncbi:MAG TPA: pseudouridine synthase, partial [Rhizorhapis sp.]|nr:pseudouridine synthase [Rhizorhapis sp.]